MFLFVPHLLEFYLLPIYIDVFTPIRNTNIYLPTAAQLTGLVQRVMQGFQTPLKALILARVASLASSAAELILQQQQRRPQYIVLTL